MLKVKKGDQVKCLINHNGQSGQQFTEGKVYEVAYDSGINNWISVVADDRGKANGMNSKHFELYKELGFEEGDIVKAYGVRGVVTSLDGCLVKVKFENEIMKSFYNNGKLESWHKTPSLKLIERPIKKAEFETIIKGDFDLCEETIGCMKDIKLTSFIGKKVKVTVEVAE